VDGPNLATHPDTADAGPWHDGDRDGSGVGYRRSTTSSSSAWKTCFSSWRDRSTGRSRWWRSSTSIPYSTGAAGRSGGRVAQTNGVRESYGGWPRAGTTPRALADLRSLSALLVVRFGRAPEVFLPADARRDVEQRGAEQPDRGVRWDPAQRRKFLERYVTRRASPARARPAGSRR